MLPPNKPPMIEFKNITFTINNNAIIRDFSATIYPGDFVVLLGSNGSGKSTLLKLINRTYRVTSGDVLLDQQSITKYDDASLRKKLITLTQFTADSIFSDLTLEENALLIEDALHKDVFQPKKLLQALPHYITEFHPTLKKALKTRMKNLSGGEQQIAALALYFRHQPDILLLDEHTSALDPKRADDVMAFTQQVITKYNITCVMTTHALHHAMHYGNRIIAIREGELLFDANAQQKSALTMTDLLQYCY